MAPNRVQDETKNPGIDGKTRGRVPFRQADQTWRGIGPADDIANAMALRFCRLNLMWPCSDEPVVSEPEDARLLSPLPWACRTHRMVAEVALDALTRYGIRERDVDNLWLSDVQDLGSRTWWTIVREDGEEERRAQVPQGAGSLVASLTSHGFHAPTLDLDFPALLVPSTTPGHHHLYLQRLMPWRRYKRLLRALLRAGIIEAGYYRASVKRRMTMLWRPGLTKENAERS